MKYDLKVHIRSNKAFYVYLKPTLPLMLLQIVCALLSLIPTKREGAVPFMHFGCGDAN